MKKNDKRSLTKRSSSTPYDPADWLRWLADQDPQAALASREVRNAWLSQVGEDELADLFEIARALTEARKRLRDLRANLTVERGLTQDESAHVMRVALGTIDDDQQSITRALLLELEELGIARDVLANASRIKREYLRQEIHRAKKDRDGLHEPKAKDDEP